MSKVKLQLTDREEEFCQLIARRGYNQTDAYIQAYGTTSDKRKTAKELASRVRRKEHIRARIDSIKSRLAYRIDWNKQKSEEKIKEIIDLAMGKGELKTALEGIRELNKMCGLHAPQTTVNVSTSITEKDARDMLSELGYVKKELPAEVISIE